MRSIVLAAALVGVAVPAMAQDREAWAERRAARAEQRRQEPRAEQSEQAPPERQRVEQQRVEQPRVEQATPQVERPRKEWHREAPSEQSRVDQPRADQPRAEQPPGGQRWTEQQRDSQRWASRPAEHRWSSDWQHDPRYDWRRYRDRNRSIFRIGSYYDPFGWGYRRVDIGFTMYAGYYSHDYWLDDPWQYRLPPAYGPFRWVRYYDDAVLVDLYSGRVVEVIRNFFW